MTQLHPRKVFVGAAPGAGKTTLAKALAARMGAPTQTFDHVVTAIRAVTSPETHPAFHRGRSSYVGYFTEGSPAQLIEDALTLEQACWPAVERICAPSRAARSLWANEHYASEARASSVSRCSSSQRPTDRGSRR